MGRFLPFSTCVRLGRRTVPATSLGPFIQVTTAIRLVTKPVCIQMLLVLGTCRMFSGSYSADVQLSPGKGVFLWTRRALVLMHLYLAMSMALCACLSSMSLILGLFGHSLESLGPCQESFTRRYLAVFLSNFLTSPTLLHEGGDRYHCAISMWL